MFQVNPEYIISDMNTLTTKSENLKTLLEDVDKKIYALTTQGWTSDSAQAYYSKINTYVSGAKAYIDELKVYFGKVQQLAQHSIDSEQQMLNNLN